MYNLVIVVGINILLVSPFPTEDECKLWGRQLAPQIIEMMKIMPVQAPALKPEWSCQKRERGAGQRYPWEGKN